MIHLMGNDFYDEKLCVIVSTVEMAKVVVRVKKVKRQNMRKLKRVNLWRKEVLKRDKNTCQSCGSKEKLQVHHHARFADIGLSGHDFIFNGITLCATCHCDKHPELPEGMKRGMHRFTSKPTSHIKKRRPDHARN